MRYSEIFVKKREDTALTGILYPLLMIGCICIAGCGHVMADTGGLSDNATTSGEQTMANISTVLDPRFVPGIGYPEELLRNAYIRGRYHRNESVLNTTNFSSMASKQERETEIKSFGGNITDLQLTWQKCLGGSWFEISELMIQTTDGGYLVGGITTSNNGDVSGYHGSDDIWVVKLDATGEITWQKCLGGSSDDELYSVIQTTDEGYLVNGGTYSDDGNVTGNHGDVDIWEVKLNSSGEIIWQKCLGGSSFEYSDSTIQTTDGGYLVGGSTRSDDGNVTGNHGLTDIWVVKLDSSGNITWQKCLGGTSYDNLGSTIQTTDGGYLVGGSTRSDNGNVTGNHGLTDIWIVKLDSAGEITWKKCLGGTDVEYFSTIAQTTDGGYLVGGSTRSDDKNVTGNHGLTDIWIVKLDPAGEITWQKCLGGTSYEDLYSVIQATDGGYLLGGITYSNNGDVSGYHGSEDIWVVKLDETGEITWQKCLGGTDVEYFRTIAQTTDGGYLLNVATESNDGNVTGYHGNSDIWVVKLDAAGEITWQKCLGGSSYENPYSVIQTSSGGYLASGTTYSNNGDVAGNHGIADIWLALLTASHPVTATSDSWTIAYPPGTTSYAEGTNATYLAQAKPGADLVNVSVDGEQVGPVNNWTFSVIAANHTFATTGQPTSGQVHAYFTLNTTWGAVPLTVQFTNQSLGDPTSFSWDFGDGGSSTGKDPIHTYTVPGTYSVTLRATNAWTGGIATLPHALTATAGVVPSPTPTPVPGEINAAFSADLTSGSAPMQVSFVDESTGNPTSWGWDLGDGTMATSRNVTHIYATEGTYSVGLTAQNSAYSGSIEKSGYITVT